MKTFPVFLFKDDCCAISVLYKLSLARGYSAYCFLIPMFPEGLISTENNVSRELFKII